MCADLEADPVAFPFLKAGYQVFVLRYSVGEASVCPNPLDDYASAAEMIRRRAGQWRTPRARRIQTVERARRAVGRDQPSPHAPLLPAIRLQHPMRMASAASRARFFAAHRQEFGERARKKKEGLRALINPTNKGESLHAQLSDPRHLLTPHRL